MVWAFSGSAMGYNGLMVAVVLGWDPDRGTRWVPPYDSALAQAAVEGAATTRYRVDGPVPAVGTTVHLMLQGATRGLVGRGTVRSAPFTSLDPAHPGAPARYVLVEWDHLLPVEERIDTEELAARVPDVAWHSLYSPSTALTDEQSERLGRVWLAPHPSARPGRSRFAPHVPGRPDRLRAIPGLGTLPLAAFAALPALAARLWHR